MASCGGEDDLLSRAARAYSQRFAVTLCAMRLTAHECATILRVVRGFTQSRGRIWLFGSRTDDNARGGDLDLMVESLQLIGER